MKNKIGGIALLTFGILFMLVSILALAVSFEKFTSIPLSAENLGYIFGSIAFPLLGTVIGRWMIRNGFKRLRTQK